MIAVKKTFKFRAILAVCVSIASMWAAPGCGGGGGGVAPAPAASGANYSQPAGENGRGKVSAVVKLTGKVGGRMAAQSDTASVNVSITITGVYSGTGAEFPEVTTTYPVNLAQGYARVQGIAVPTGVNHLLTVKADWGSGAVEVVKAIIPEVEADKTTTVTANQESTAVAEAALLYASSKGKRLADLDSELIVRISEAVALYGTTTEYAAMTPEGALSFMEKMGVPAGLSLSPATGTVLVGQTMQLTARAYDENNTTIASAAISWSVSPSTAGSVSSSGLFSAAAPGSAVITASYLTYTASASLTILATCSTAADCSDGLALTYDTCAVPGTNSCSHTAIACATVSDCNDNNVLTLDACNGGGTLSAACSNTAFACNEGLDCDDRNALTLDVCSGGGTLSAACSNTAFACNSDSDCNDNNALTIDACAGGGTASATCGHTSFACNTNSDCNDGNPNTDDFCSDGGAVAAACSHTINYLKISAGGKHACALKPDGTVECWGDNRYGQSGDGSAVPPGMVMRLAGKGRSGAGGGSRVTGRAPSRAAADEAARFAAQIAPVERFTLDPSPVVGLSGVTQIAAGDWGTCALLSSGSVKCWGANWENVLGDGTGLNSSVPVDVADGLGGILTGVVQISLSNDHACALMNDTTVKCWGWNGAGELGDGTTIESGVPVTVLDSLGSPLTGVAQVSAGSWHTCALMTDGTAKCWGDNNNMQLGDGGAIGFNSPAPVDVQDGLGGLLTGVEEIYAGANQTCAVMVGGAAKCWGGNINGQLGDGTLNNAMYPQDVSDGAGGVLTGVDYISAGQEHTCAYMLDSSARCWGMNNYGQLGSSANITIANYIEYFPAAPTDIPGQIVGVAASHRGDYTCFALQGGTFKCAGAGGYGNLGDGRAFCNTLPRTEFGLSSVLGFSMKGNHACVVNPDGSLSCWGANTASGLLGDGREVGWPAPVTAAGISGAVDVSAGVAHTCALLSGGTVTCWGENTYGQLGNNDTLLATSLTPVPVVGVTGVVDIVSGMYHTCALLNTGGVKCWGGGANGELGDGLMLDAYLPVDVGDGLGGVLTGATAISAGDNYTCALMAGGAMKCWGYNVYGQLGDGTTNSAPLPVDVMDGLGSPLTGIQSISTGGYHACALMAGGTIKCWGNDTDGELGDGNTGVSSQIPVDVAGISGASEVSAGTGYTCAVVGGVVKCWGNNQQYTLGIGDLSGALSILPVDVAGITDAISVRASQGRACAESASRGLLCWGLDLYTSVTFGYY